MIEVRYAVINNANSIFGSVGRCGAGYNTVWADWTEQGRKNYKNITEEFEQQFDAHCQHYEKLEQDILKNGFLNPLIITCGKPLIRQNIHIPPELLALPEQQLLILEGTDGGSRLWVAQKHNLPVPCIINDRTGRFRSSPLIRNVAQAQRYFNTPPVKALMTPQKGYAATGLQPIHIDDCWKDNDKLHEIRMPIWFTVMKKYGYVANVRPELKKYIEHLL